MIRAAGHFCGRLFFCEKDIAKGFCEKEFRRNLQGSRDRTSPENHPENHLFLHFVRKKCRPSAFGQDPGDEWYYKITERENKTD